MSFGSQSYLKKLLREIIQLTKPNLYLFLGVSAVDKKVNDYFIPSYEFLSIRDSLTWVSWNHWWLLGPVIMIINWDSPWQKLWVDIDL